MKSPDAGEGKGRKVRAGGRGMRITGQSSSTIYISDKTGRGALGSRISQDSQMWVCSPDCIVRCRRHRVAGGGGSAVGVAGLGFMSRAEPCLVGRPGAFEDQQGHKLHHVDS